MARVDQATRIARTESLFRDVNERVPADGTPSSSSPVTRIRAVERVVGRHRRYAIIEKFERRVAGW